MAFNTKQRYDLFVKHKRKREISVKDSLMSKDNMKGIALMMLPWFC